MYRGHLVQRSNFSFCILIIQFSLTWKLLSFPTVFLAPTENHFIIMCRFVSRQFAEVFLTMCTVLCLCEASWVRHYFDGVQISLAVSPFLIQIALEIWGLCSISNLRCFLFCFSEECHWNPLVILLDVLQHLSFRFMGTGYLSIFWMFC